MNRMIPPEITYNQKRASMPSASAWVSANAGSGKTHVLSERVIRLLLNGSDPSRILCLTYTKAAASVMQTRIFERLSRWIGIDDAQLSVQLRDLTGVTPDQPTLQRARQLFARALETPGGLKIQTIHAFCESLLHRFPLEANIAGHFEMLDDLAQNALVQNVRQTLLQEFYYQPQSPLAQSFARVITLAGQESLFKLFETAISERRKLLAFFDKALEENNTIADWVPALFGLKGTETSEGLIAQMLVEARPDKDLLACLEAFGGSTAQEFVYKIKQLDLLKTEQEKFDCLRDIWLTGAGKPRGLANIATKKVKEKDPEAEDRLASVQNRFVALLEQYYALQMLACNIDSWVLCDTFLRRYEDAKMRRGLLDFDDLIYRTLLLLKRHDAGPWVQYKLDRGIDHILVDEAQDTSPEQWEIVRLLSAEFFSGAGQRQVKRTVFAVGDEKQSIYSFQGAVPEDFDANRRFIETQVNNVEETFERVNLNFSFRSTPDVLAAVDAVFSDPENYRGLSAANEKTIHSAIRSTDAGQVDIWDLQRAEKIKEPEDWRLPVDHLQAPPVKLAEQIAQQIQDWLQQKQKLPGKNKIIEPKDIMILVRKRDLFIPALSRALKIRNIAVAGADRLLLSDHIAVKDLVALGRFILQPNDDLSLASLFKSPLLGGDEQKLYQLATAREAGVSLYQTMQNHVEQDAHLARIVDFLEHCRNLADTVPVYEFYSFALTQMGGRRKILARLGYEANDILDAFMDYALEQQRAGLPGLQAFLENLTIAQPEIKREMDQLRNEVRIMTVHAAKGLEAPIVFLVDPGSAAWHASHAPALLEVSVDQDHSRQRIHGFLWKPNKQLSCATYTQKMEELKILAEQEYRRLLYVAMTRAEDRLIVCGYNSLKSSDKSWWHLVYQALAPLSEQVTGPDANTTVWRYQITPPEQQQGEDKQYSSPKIEQADTDDNWLFEKAVAETGPPRPLAPSHAALIIDSEPLEDSGQIAASPILAATTQDVSFAIRRGNAIHFLLEHIVTIDVALRREKALEWLGHYAPEWDLQTKQSMLDDVFNIVDDPQFDILFSANSRAEVSIMGHLNIGRKKRPVAGKIDRLAVTENRLIIADFKTGYVPQDHQAVTPTYIAQLALYRELLRPLYPDHSMTALLIYTQGPKIIHIEDAQMDQILQQLDIHPL